MTIDQQEEIDRLREHLKLAVEALETIAGEGNGWWQDTARDALAAIKEDSHDQ